MTEATIPAHRRSVTTRSGKGVQIAPGMPSARPKDAAKDASAPKADAPKDDAAKADAAKV